MNRILRTAAPAVLALALAAGLSGCGKDAPAKGGKGAPGKGPARVLKVEGYAAKPAPTATEFRTTGTLRASESVELRAETAGRIVSLPVGQGSRVGKGALIAKLDASELEAQLKSARAKLELASAEHGRAEALHEKGSLTDSEFESSAASLRAAEAAVELLAAQIAKTEIRAPFAGTLGLVDLSKGARVAAGDGIALLSASGKLDADFALPQRHSSALKPGDSVAVSDPERGVSVRAVVRALDAELSAGSRTRKIRAEIDNRSGKLIAGAYVEVVVPLGTSAAGSIPVPAEAFTLDDEGPFVYLARGGKAEARRVKTGLRTPISVEVLSGLEPGDTVVVTGLINLRDGAPVEIVSLQGALREARDR